MPIHQTIRSFAVALVLALVPTGAVAHAQTTPSNSLEESRNNVGVAYDPLSGADFDGGGRAFSSLALELANVTPGGTVTAEGFDFVWPDTASGEPDNVVAAGQTIAVTSRPDATRLGVLGAAHGDGEVTATISLNYVDAEGLASTDAVTIRIGAWTGDPLAGDQAPSHDVTSDFHVIGSILPVPVPAGVDAAVVPLDPSRTLVSVGLPDDSRLHVFDLRTGPATSGGGEPAAPPPINGVVAALPFGNVAGFGPRTVTVFQGQALDFVNLDPTGPHDLVSVKRGPDFKRLFSSASVPFGEIAPVVGVEKLPAGTYGFVCSIHGAMQGQLSVQAAAAG